MALSEGKMTANLENGVLVLELSGRIDSNNVAQLESDIISELAVMENVDVAFDALHLTYISSAGLRVLLKVKKKLKKPVKIMNVTDEVFDILEVTGFTEILDVERIMRTISIRGCKKISSALNGEIFKLSEDEMIKVYGSDVTLDEIKKERSYAQTALVAGIPTLIPYDVVKTENGYGIVFEKVEMKSLAYVLAHEPQKMPELADRFAEFMKELHTTEIMGNKLPDIKDRYREWIEKLDNKDDSQTAMFSNIIASIPDSDMYVHGDINLNSVMVRDDEMLLMDMAGSAHGNSLFDLQGLFASLVAIEKSDEGYCRRNYGVTSQICIAFWNAFFKKYMNNREQEINSMNELLAKYYVLKQRILLKLENKNNVFVENS